FVSLAWRFAIRSSAPYMPIASFLLIICAIIPGFSSVAFAQDIRTAVAVRISSNLQVDGALNEPEWVAAQPIGEILQREPKPGEAATERTEVKVLFNDDFLYVGVVCLDSEPNK